MSPALGLDLIVLFFFLGVLASWAKSDLEFPEAISKFFSIFLLLSLGLKGGQEVRNAENLEGFSEVLLLGLSSCALIPLVLFSALRKKLGPADAAGIAAAYGSVSAVTLIAAQGALTNHGIAYSGYMTAVMALMEIPAIMIALSLYRRARGAPDSGSGGPSLWATKSVVLLLGGFLIGALMTPSSFASIAPVVRDSFKGVLAFFLLDLGIAAQRHARAAWRHNGPALVLGVFAPLIHGTLALAASSFFAISLGDRVLLAVLVGSASYIAAPAAIRSAIPQANASLYVALPLALTFPVNLVLGIPLYVQLASRL